MVVSLPVVVVVKLKISRRNPRGPGAVCVMVMMSATCAGEGSDCEEIGGGGKGPKFSVVLFLGVVCESMALSPSLEAPVLVLESLSDDVDPGLDART